MTVTVVASDAVQAELHAKVALILGSRAGREYLAELRDVEGLMVLQDGNTVASSGMGRLLLKDSMHPGRA
jgi:thiamine biosynthesis lipoprotein ApbE